MTDLVDILIPEEQQEGTELELSAWLKAVGERVEKDEPIAELVTDKAVVELPAPVTGVIVEHLVSAETQVEPDAVLGRIEVVATVVAASSAPAPAPEAEVGPPKRPDVEVAPAVDATGGGGRPAPHPAVTRRAAQLGVDLGAVEGTGRDGRVTRGDLEARVGTASPPRRSSPARAASRAPDRDAGGPRRLVRHDPMRRSIARHMTESVQVAPHVTAVFPCDLTRVMAHRERVKASFKSRGSKLTFSAYFLRATAEAVREVPEVNARWRDEGLEIYEEVHVGVGTALEDQGLVVPVIRGVESMDLEACAAELTRLTDRARAGQLSAAEMRGSTITISNHGVMGSLFASPIIINQPESAILGIGKIEKRPVVIEQKGRESVEIRPMMYVSLTIDHRALDAFHTNRFLTRFCSVLESWEAE